jgi:hypothetical protein
VQEIVAAVRQLPGFQSIVLGANRATGEAIAVTTFDTEEHARWRPDPTSGNEARIRAAGIQIDQPDIFEVTTPT